MISADPGHPLLSATAAVLRRADHRVEFSPWTARRSPWTGDRPGGPRPAPRPTSTCSRRGRRRR
ncbi:hypothetical protein O1L55_27900 [Streptomyces albulus]|nr:hypothetical protein [Streptomyces noursei]